MKINGIPIKIRTKEEMDRILNRDPNQDQGKGGPIFFIGAIGNKKTGKIVEVHKIDPKTNKKTILFRDKNDKLFKKEK